MTFEVNFDGLIGPTHNHGGLSFGNVASNKHAALTSSPKKAALQGLEKMKALADMGMKQAVLPPHERPYIPTLRELGFQGETDSDVLKEVVASAPYLLKQVSSASNMWVANAATVSPFSDTQNGKTHFTPANLSSMFHRSIEAKTTSNILKAIFQGDDYSHHEPLPAGEYFSDEGAANHTRFCQEYGQEGVEFFVYGASRFNPNTPKPAVFPARQTLEASQAIARKHGLSSNKTVFAQQNPIVIDAGVFHNDVIAVGTRDLLFYHELAFLDSEQVISQLEESMDGHFQSIKVADSEVPLKDAVSSYLFNSQLLTVPEQTGYTLIVPGECMKVESVKTYLDSLPERHQQINQVHYFNLEQSMRNGGGPACLRLRVVMSQQQIEQTKANVFLTDSLYQELKDWVNRHYRDELTPDDLYDPALLAESRAALDELTQILNIGPIYDFQKN
ncbi:N-succinylarginine dihydrolase [Marinomonas sp. C2222]|uniref:N-succinylarginine dihydrolase n=1 Tax=Marinomonas sargassi TaxID=2984494 RepID=A0ABT2YPM5_9GAMM|nr:N-succinylarginine dihydrolase [Marinomonas sargassi]MCV2401832.1 N-succinylarginine dihydrolase [Marinomonas sargassi]